MVFSLRRLINHKVRARRWVAYLFSGLLIMGLGFTIFSLAVLMLAPATVETLRSFHPLALAFTAFTAMLISSFWFYITAIGTTFKISSFTKAVLQYHESGIRIPHSV